MWGRGRGRGLKARTSRTEEYVILVSEIPGTRLRGRHPSLKCHWDQNFGIPYFYIFEHSLWFLVTLPNFNLLRRLEVAFFRTVFVEILRPPLLALVPEAGLRMSGSDVRGSPQT